jgi:hypothetical protein
VILLVLLVVVIGVGIGLRGAARQRPLSAFNVRTAVLAGGVIAAVRLALFWMGLALAQRPDWRQVAGYVLVTVSAILDLGMASWARGMTGWVTLMSALIVVTSFVLGWAWAWSVAPSPEPRIRR